jgi:hypothetical protein
VRPRPWKQRASANIKVAHHSPTRPSHAALSGVATGSASDSAELSPVPSHMAGESPRCAWIRERSHGSTQVASWSGMRYLARVGGREEGVAARVCMGCRVPGERKRSQPRKMNHMVSASAVACSDTGCWHHRPRAKGARCASGASGGESEGSGAGAGVEAVRQHQSSWTWCGLVNEIGSRTEQTNHPTLPRREGRLCVRRSW